MSVKHIRGNIFNTKCQTIVNTVNCVGVMGKGIALVHKLRYPEMYLEYKNHCAKGLIKPGHLSLYTKQPNAPWILNFPTKFHWKYPSKIEWLESGLQKFVESYEKKGITSIAFPLLGTHNGGLDTEIVKSQISKGDIVVDVGASIGYYSLILARAVGKEGHVFAFEPRPERFELLQKNVEINGYDNITIEQMAVLDQNGETDFYYSKNQKTGFKLEVSEKEKEMISEKATTKTVRLEDYFKEREIQNKIKFIKSDVDGPEFAVLKSAGCILQNKDLKVFFEWDYESIKIAGDSPEEVLELLYKNNFKIYSPDFKNNKYSPIEKSNLLSSKISNSVNLLCKKNN